MTPAEALAVVRDAASDDAARIRMERAGFDAPDADDIAAALETLARCVVLSVEDASLLSSCVSEEMSGAPPGYRAALRRFRAAIAEAEEAMR